MVDGRQQSSAEMADDEANRKLIRIGGVASVHMEFNDLHAGKASREVESRKYRPQLTMAILILAATHWHEFMFYASGHLVLEVVLHSYPLITAMANAATTLVSVYAEEGNSSLKIFVTINIAFKFGISWKPGELSKEFAAAVVLLICVSIAGFARSCGL